LASDLCSYYRSRQVRQKLSNVLHYVESRKYKLDATCPFKPSLDKLSFHESEKSMHQSHWRCDVCDKQFKEEQHLDKHLGRVHEDLIPKEATVCLADYCDVFQCYSIDDGSSFRACAPEIMEKLKINCEALASRCFPPHRPDAYPFHELFLSEICGLLTCKPYKPVPIDTIMGSSPIVIMLLWIVGILFAAICGSALCYWYMVRQRNTTPSTRRRRIDDQPWWKRVFVFKRGKIKGY